MLTMQVQMPAWSQLPDSSSEGCALAIVNGLPTLIGGIGNDVTNQLFSLRKIGESSGL